MASTKVGFGVASDGNQKHVVARYSPRGNFGGNADYEANVLPAGSTGTDGGSSGGSDGGSGGEYNIFLNYGRSKPVYIGLYQFVEMFTLMRQKIPRVFPR